MHSVLFVCRVGQGQHPFVSRKKELQFIRVTRVRIFRCPLCLWNTVKYPQSYISLRVCYVATFCGRLKLYILYHISDYFKQFNSSLIDKIQFSSELGASSGLCIHRTFKTWHDIRFKAKSCLFSVTGGAADNRS